MSQQSAQAIRDEHAAASRARRSRREQEKYFQRTSPTQQRADNVSRAMANGSFAQTRFDFNKSNAGKAAMDSAGNISPVASPKPFAQPRTDTVPAGGGGYKEVPVRPPAQEQQGPPKSAMPQQMGPPKALMQNRTAPTSSGLINGKPAGEVFQSLADQQKQPNKFAQPRQAPATEALPAVTPSPTWGKTAGEIIADIDRTQADVAERTGVAQGMFNKPRTAPNVTDNVTPEGRMKIINDAVESMKPTKKIASQ